jgi:hypothetical protein
MSNYTPDEKPTDSSADQTDQGEGATPDTPATDETEKSTEDSGQ